MMYTDSLDEQLDIEVYDICIDSQSSHKRKEYKDMKQSGIGIVNRSLYYGSRGDVFELSEMQSSHILNVLVMHERQLATLDSIIQTWANDAISLDTRGLESWRNHIADTVTSLAIELSSRKVGDGQ